jgi:hypothetical protein
MFVEDRSYCVPLEMDVSRLRLTNKSKLMRERCIYWRHYAKNVDIDKYEFSLPE